MGGHLWSILDILKFQDYKGSKCVVTANNLIFFHQSKKTCFLSKNNRNEP